MQLELSKFRAKELLRVGKVLGQEAAEKGQTEKFIVLNLPQLQGDGKALDEAAKVYINRNCLDDLFVYTGVWMICSYTQEVVHSVPSLLLPHGYTYINRCICLPSWSVYFQMSEHRWIKCGCQ